MLCGCCPDITPITNRPGRPGGCCPEINPHSKLFPDPQLNVPTTAPFHTIFQSSIVPNFKIIRTSQGYVPNVPQCPSHVPPYRPRPKPNVPESSSDVPRNIRNVPESRKLSKNRPNCPKVPENRDVIMALSP